MYTIIIISYGLLSHLIFFAHALSVIGPPGLYFVPVGTSFDTHLLSGNQK